MTPSIGFESEAPFDFAQLFNIIFRMEIFLNYEVRDLKNLLAIEPVPNKIVPYLGAYCNVRIYFF